MLAHLVTAIGFTTWAYLLWAHLPKAFRLQIQPKPVAKTAFKRSWALGKNPGVVMSVAAVFLALIQLTAN
jgi:hypothetical protein